MTSTALAPREQHGALVQAHGVDVLTLGKTLAQSGYFKDAADAAKAVVKILFGQEVGIGPATAMSAIYVVEGKPTYSATLMAALVKRSGKYDYRILRLDDDGCEIVFLQREGGKWDELGKSSFTLADARAANLSGKQVWKSYARNMLFARALSNGCRWYTPDIFGGTPAYTPEELGAEVDGTTGEAIIPALPAPRAETEPAKPTKREGLLAKYQALCVDARALDLEPVELTEDAPDDVIIEHGKQLRAAIADAEFALAGELRTAEAGGSR
jgi:hypothetical protein